MNDDRANESQDKADPNDPKEAPVDGPGGDEDEGGLGATSQGSPGEAEGGGSSGA